MQRQTKNLHSEAKGMFADYARKARKVQMDNAEKLKQLDNAAYKNQDMPTGLHMPEVYYFLCMRYIYAMYRMDKISKEHAEQEKQIARSTYANFELVNRVGEHDMKILREVQKSGDYYKKDGCPKCKKLYEQLCGLAVELDEEVEV